MVRSDSHLRAVRRPTTCPSADESVYRFAATGSYEAPRLFSRVTPVFSAGVGVVHAAGVQTDFSQYQNDPFFGITDQRTGFTAGGGLSLEFPVGPRAMLTGSLQVWRDRLYGGRLYNVDQMFGVAWRF
jgi:hypothetical protein